MKRSARTAKMASLGRSLLLALGGVLAVLMLLLVALTGWAALSRRLPGGQPEGIYEVIVLLCVWTVFIGAAFAQWEGKSIFAGEPYAPSGNWRPDALQGVSTAILSILAWAAVFWQGLDLMRWQLEGGRESVQLGIPLAAFTMSMLASAVILTGLALTTLARSLIMIVTRPR